jgi:hypothetical protein
MWRLRLPCEGISTRLNFRNVGDILYSLSLLMGALARHATTQPKKLQLHKELSRLQEIDEDATTAEGKPTKTEVCKVIVKRYH